jgi:hypothetical protein
VFLRDAGLDFARRKGTLMSLTEHVVQTDGELFLLAIDDYLTKCEAEVNGKLWRPATAKEAEGYELAPPPSGLLYAALMTAADLLEVVAPCSLRQLLIDILNNVPTDQLGVPALARARKLLKARWTHLLDLDCHTVAGLLREKVLQGLVEDDEQAEQKIKRMREHIRQLEKSASSSNAVDGKSCTGTGEWVQLSWNNKDYYFGEKQGNLLFLLSGKTDRLKAGDARDEGEVIEYVYHDPCYRDKIKAYKGNLRNLQYETTQALRKRDILLKIIRPGRGFLQLVNTSQ